MKKKRERLSLHPMTPEIALRRALNTPAPRLKCAACGKVIASPKALRVKKGQPYHRTCPK
jgi:hypothetical protein